MSDATLIDEKIAPLLTGVVRCWCGFHRSSKKRIQTWLGNEMAKAVQPAGRADLVLVRDSLQRDRQRQSQKQFRKEAALDDPDCLFNTSLDGTMRRAMDITEGDALHARALKALVRAALDLNTGAAQSNHLLQQRSCS
jgi:hypothetical protein